MYLNNEGIDTSLYLCNWRYASSNLTSSLVTVFNSINWTITSFTFWLLSLSNTLPVIFLIVSSANFIKLKELAKNSIDSLFEEQFNIYRTLYKN